MESRLLSGTESGLQVFSKKLDLLVELFIDIEQGQNLDTTEYNIIDEIKTGLFLSLGYDFTREKTRAHKEDFGFRRRGDNRRFN